MMDTNLILIGVTALNAVVLLVVAFVCFRILQSERAQQADLLLLLHKQADQVPGLLAAKPPDAAAVTITGELAGHAVPESDAELKAALDRIRQRLG